MGASSLLPLLVVPIMRCRGIRLAKCVLEQHGLFQKVSLIYKSGQRRATLRERRTTLFIFQLYSLIHIHESMLIPSRSSVARIYHD